MKKQLYTMAREAQVLFCGTVPIFLLTISILGGAALAKPKIVGPLIYGVYPGTPFIHTLGAINVGANKIFSVQGLPGSLTLDASTGIITGTAPAKGRYLTTVVVSGTEGTDTTAFDIRSGDTLSYTPPMGWNSWNMCGATVSEVIIKKIADSMVTRGFRDFGYQYICIDDSWSLKGRDANGDMRSDPTRFPSGIKALADYVHSRGLKLGIYTDIGPSTFSIKEGSGYENYEHDALMFAKWGIDFIKCDNMGGTGNATVTKNGYKRLGTAMKSSGRSMILSVCEWGRLKPWDWSTESNGHLWRVTWDLRDTWKSPNYTAATCGIMNSLDFYWNDIEPSIGVKDIYKFSGPGVGWNDLDMMYVGMYGENNNGGSGMTDMEYQTHMGLWSILSSPLILSKNITGTIKDVAKKQLLNEEIIAINQDILGKQAMRLSKNGDLEVYTRLLQDSSRVVGFLNRGTTNASMTIQWAQLGISGKFVVGDVWQRSDVGTFETSYTCDVVSHELKVLKLSKVSGTPIIGYPLTNTKTTDVFLRMTDAGNRITIIFSRTIDRIELINMQGKKIFDCMAGGEKEYGFNKSYLPSGIYLLKVVDNKKNMHLIHFPLVND